MSTQQPILIIGGGIGGLASALALSRLGIPTLVIEQADEFREVGAGIQVGPNGFRALDRLGVLAQARELAVLPDELIMMDSVNATPVVEIPAGDSFIERFQYPYALIHRADLHNVLLNACRASSQIEFRTSTRVASFSEANGKMNVTTAQGEVISGSALIGADGLWSKVRESIVGEGAPRVSGHIAYRAVIPIEEVPEAYLRTAMNLWCGHKNHLVQYPLRGGKLFNLVAVFHSDRYVEGWNTEGDPEELKQRFAGTCDTVQELLAKIDSWRMWVLCDREPVKEWSRGLATLVGDAAHPMLQYLAQGACMAIEDAVVLADEVARCSDDIASAFQAYQQRRYLRTGRCQIMARVHGEFYHATGVTAELRNAMLASRTPEQSYEGLAWLYDKDI